MIGCQRARAQVDTAKRHAHPAENSLRDSAVGSSGSVAAVILPD